MQFFGKTKIDFIGWRKVAFIISAVAIAVGIASLIIKGGPGLGLDFTGGVEVHVKFENFPRIGKIRQALSRIGLGRAVIQQYGSREENTILIRYHLEEISEEIASSILNYRREKGGFKKLEELKSIPAVEGVGYQNLLNIFTLDPAVTDKINLNQVDREILISLIQDVNSRQMAAKIEKVMEKQFSQGNSFEIISINLIGPKVSRELQRAALLAIIFALVGMLIYIAWRFEFRFAVGAVVALIHDVFISVGALSLGDFEFTLPVIAALLTIVGYSLNDTIVIYDRIRENMKTFRKKKTLLKDVLNLSINQSLSRTLITSLTTFIVVLVLFLWGGESLRTFTFTLLIGIIVGTYSSSFVATPVVYLWGKKK
jgi:preprotein translocase subunit SecF